MSIILTTENMAKKQPEPEYRDRLDLKVAPSLRARVEKQAERRGLGLSGYVRQAVIMQLEADEATDPDLAVPKKKS